MENRYYVLLTGTAGSGKTTLAKALGQWLGDQNVGVTWVNLDPAAETIPYPAHVDVRDYVRASDVMKKYNLGPNGALLASVDLLSNHIEELRKGIEDSPAPYTLIDTPGQLELFAYRQVSLDVVRSLVNPYTTVNVFLIDGVFLTNLANLASLLALALSVQLRLGVPQVNVISKADLLPPEMLESVEQFNEDPESLVLRLREERGPYVEFAEKIYNVVLEEGFQLHPVSGLREEGVARVFSEVQKALGEEEALETNLEEVI